MSGSRWAAIRIAPATMPQRRMSSSAYGDVLRLGDGASPDAQQDAGLASGGRQPAHLLPREVQVELAIRARFVEESGAAWTR